MLRVAVCLAVVAAAYAAAPHPPHENPHLVSRSKNYTKAIVFLLEQWIANEGMPRSYQDVLPDGDSYWATQTYAKSGAFDANGTQVAMDSQVAIQERVLVHEGLNLYDAATWQIALSLWRLHDYARSYERNILYPSTTGPGYGANIAMGSQPSHLPGIKAGLANIRADGDDMQYGDDKILGSALKQIPYPGNASHFKQNPINGLPDNPPTKKGPGSFWFRMIGPHYFMRDPFLGYSAQSWVDPWPVPDPTTKWNGMGYIHWNDWKPITGENVWAAMIGPIQSLALATGGNYTNVTCGTPEHPLICDFKKYETTPPQIQVGITILPALDALLSKRGSLFHCPKGAKIWPYDPDEGANVSNENNFSAYAALKMLAAVLNNYTKNSADEYLTYGRTTANKILKAMDVWLDSVLLSDPKELPDGSRLVYQGGHVIGTTFKPAKLDTRGGVAVDCQTWGMTVMGAPRMDKSYGTNTAFKIWQATKKYAGHFINNKIAGVGYTTLIKNTTVQPNHKIWSAEWTFGAINMCQVLAGQYKQMGNMDNFHSLMSDAVSMYEFTTQPQPNGLQMSDGSYVYANARFFIPWGWYSNPIGALCSTAWAVMQEQEFNPFELGGGNKPKLAEYKAKYM